MTNEQREARKAYDAEYHRANKAHLRAVRAAWAAAHPEKIRASVKKCHGRHRDRVLVNRRARHAADPSKQKAQARKWYAENKERKAATSRAWYLANRAAVIAKDRARHVADPIKKKARDAEYVKNHPEQERARRAAWAARNPDKVRSYSREYCRRNPEKGRAIQQARRAKKIGVQVGDRKAYAAFVKWSRSAPSVPCYWCKTKTKPGRRHLDHIIPLTKGGPDAVANLCVSCPHCNLTKNAKMPEHFAGQSELRLA